jgi:hypothetical protein
MGNNRIWAGWLVVLTVIGMLLTRGVGLLPEAALVNTASAESAVLPSPQPERRVLMSLAGCGVPDRVGAFGSGDVPCRPVSAWTLSEFASQLVGLNVLIAGETLATLPAPANANCPWLAMRGQAATGAKVCLTPQGGIYRDMGGANDGAWNWQFNAAGQWRLNLPAVARQ